MKLSFMLRRVLTSKSLRYGLGLALLSHPPATAEVRLKPHPRFDLPPEIDKPNCRYCWEFRTHTGPFLRHTSIYTGWWALQKAMTVPFSTEGHSIYEATSLPAIILKFRWAGITAGRRPVGGY